MKVASHNGVRAIRRTGNASAPAAQEPDQVNLPEPGQQLFDAENILLQRRMRFNPLRALDPVNLSIALDQFDIGILRQAAMLWDAMCKRDDTLISVKPQLENAVKTQDWQVLKTKGAPEPEASRHAAALQYFYDHVQATDAFDRNKRGNRDLLIEQMMSAASYGYAVHHFVWKPRPGETVDVPGAQPVPALRAELEFVPLWYFENTTGTLRFLPFGGFGIVGEPCDWENEWMCACSTGIMFAASICYMFKRLSFQDWTVFNERYAQNKVVGMTPGSKESPQGMAMASVVEHFNSDQGICIYEQENMDKPPIQLLGPNGTVSMELFKEFIDRQDRKLTVMYRGSDLRSMSREKDAVGSSVQGEETRDLHKAFIRQMAQAANEGIDRKVIRFCFGEGVEPLARFSTPSLDAEDSKDLRDSAGFLADRGVLVRKDAIAERLGIELAEKPADALQGITAMGIDPVTGGKKPPGAAAAGDDELKDEKTLLQFRKSLEATANAAPGSLADKLNRILDGSDEQLLAGLKAILGHKPASDAELLQDPNFVHEVYDILAGALKTANGEGPGHPFRGNHL